MLKNILLNENITEYALIPFDNNLVINERLLPQGDINSILVFLVPYRCEITAKDNYGVSAYARVKDYHGYMKGLFERIVPRLTEAYGTPFYGFSDHSPLNEKLCAAYGGLGVIGKNSLLINEEYGSFVFIGICLSALKPVSPLMPIKSCINCGICAATCPGNAIGDGIILSENCLSGLSQKKILTDAEQKKVTEARLCWGCDICQNACPMNKNARFTPIPYFADTFLESLSPKIIQDMSDDEYRQYAFSWRKKEVRLRNMYALDKNKHK